MRSRIPKIVEKKTRDKREQKEPSEGAEERKKKKRLMYNLVQVNWGSSVSMRQWSIGIFTTLYHGNYSH